VLTLRLPLTPAKIDLTVAETLEERRRLLKRMLAHVPSRGCNLPIAKRGRREDAGKRHADMAWSVSRSEAVLRARLEQRSSSWGLPSRSGGLPAVGAEGVRAARWLKE